MPYQIKNPVSMNRLLWLDTSMGWITAALFLTFSSEVSELLGLPRNFILLVAGVNALYASFSLLVASRKNSSVPFIRVLISANWFWAVVSIGLVIYHFGVVTVLGKVFLIGQVLVVGGLAYLENSQLSKT